jgi:hypothetical protein
MGEGLAGENRVSPADVLTTVLDEILVTADDWCQGHGALNAAGEPTLLAAGDGVKFCMAGGIRQALNRLGLHDMTGSYIERERYWDLVTAVNQAVIDAIPDACDAHSAISIPHFNDTETTTFEDVRLVFKAALEAVS